MRGIVLFFARIFYSLFLVVSYILLLTAFLISGFSALILNFFVGVFWCIFLAWMFAGIVQKYKESQLHFRITEYFERNYY